MNRKILSAFLIVLLVLSSSTIALENSFNPLAFLEKNQITPETPVEQPVKLEMENGKAKMYGKIRNEPEKFLKNNEKELKIKVSDLELVESTTTKRNGKILRYTTYIQKYNGLPVHNSYVKIFGKDDNINSIKSTFQPNIRISTEPEINENKAIKTAKEDLGIKNVKPDKIELIIFPRNGKHHLVYKIDFPLIRDPLGDWIVFVDARNGIIVEKEDTIIYENLNGTVTGMIYPEHVLETKVEKYFKDQEVSLYAHSSVYTDENGYYEFIDVPDPLLLTAYLSGRWVSVSNAQETEAFHDYMEEPGTHNWNWADYDNSNRTEESNVYYHTNVVHDFFTRDAEGEGPFDLHVMDYQMDAVVNEPGTCNAYYTQNSIHFFPGDDFCESTALLSDVIYHEYVHGVTDQLYKYVDFPYWDQTGHMNEGYSDYFPASMNNNSCMAEGFFIGEDCLRDLNNTARYPDDYDQEPHGIIFPGALWDLRVILGAETTDELVILTMKMTPTSFSEFVDDMLLIDDDNDDLSDGTPNLDAICTAFTKNHGIFSQYCTDYLVDPIAIITYPTFYEQYISENTVIITGTAYPSGGQTLEFYELMYKKMSDSDWISIGIYYDSVLDGELGTWDLTEIESGKYNILLNVSDGTAVKNTMTTITVRDYNPAITCSESPCIASSDMIKSRGFIYYYDEEINEYVEAFEPNTPNTIDNCVDGDSGTYLIDESLENITITNLDGVSFETGDTVNVSLWAYCYGSGDNVNIIYTENADEPKWDVIDYFYCNDYGFEEFTTNITLENAGSNHAIRGLVEYGGWEYSVCGMGPYDDADDIVLEVVDLLPPEITTYYPLNESLADTSDLVVHIETDENATCSWELDSCTDSTCVDHSNGDFDNEPGFIHTVNLTGLEEATGENYYLFDVYCTDLAENSAQIQNKFYAHDIQISMNVTPLTVSVTQPATIKVQADTGNTGIGYILAAISDGNELISETFIYITLGVYTRNNSSYFTDDEYLEFTWVPKYMQYEDERISLINFGTEYGYEFITHAFFEADGGSFGEMVSVIVDMETEKITDIRYSSDVSAIPDIVEGVSRLSFMYSDSDKYNYYTIMNASDPLPNVIFPYVPTGTYTIRPEFYGNQTSLVTGEDVEITVDHTGPEILVAYPQENDTIETSSIALYLTTDENAVCAWMLEECETFGDEHGGGLACKWVNDSSMEQTGETEHRHEITGLSTTYENESYMIEGYCRDEFDNSMEYKIENLTVLLDADGDGIPDEDDLFNFVPEMISTNIDGLTCNIEGVTDFSTMFVGTRHVWFNNSDNETVIEFLWNFTPDNQLDLSNLAIEKQIENSTAGSLVVSGLDMPEGETKTLYVDRFTDGTTLCINDAEVPIGFVLVLSESCDGENEYYIGCNGLLHFEKYTCTIDNDTYIVSGLEHSGILELYLPPPPPPAPSGGGGGGGGGGVTNSIYFSNLEPDTEKTKAFKDKKIPLRSIGLTVNKKVSYTTITGRSAKAQKIELPQEDYKFFNIVASLNNDLIKTAKITFEVERSWLINNSIDRNTITLYRYFDGEWQELSTLLKTETTETITYTATTPGFSIFGISGSPIQTIAPTEQTQEIEGPTGMTIGNTGLGESLTEGITEGLTGLLLADPNIAIFALVIIVLIGGLFYERKIHKKKTRRKR